MKKIITLLSVLMLTLTTKVYAVNVAESDETINQTGKYDSTRFLAGNTINSKAEIDGISFVAGNDLTLEGKTSYGFYAGNIININEIVEKDLFAAGNNITIGEDAKIERDVYIVGNQIKIKTDLNRDLRAGGTRVDISGITIKGDAYIASEQIILDENTVIEGKLTYPEDAKITGFEKAKVEKTEKIKTTNIEIEYTMKDRIRSFIFSSISAILTLIIVFFIIPSAKEKLDKNEVTPGNVLKTTGIGFLTLIIVPIVALVSLITIVLSPVALIALVMYIISIYLSSLFAYYIVGNEITKKMNKENKYLAIIIGVVSVKLIKFIPVIGGLVSAFAFFYGMGLIVYFMKRKSS